MYFICFYFEMILLPTRIVIKLIIHTCSLCMKDGRQSQSRYRSGTSTKTAERQQSVSRATGWTDHVFQDCYIAMF